MAGKLGEIWSGKTQEEQPSREKPWHPWIFKHEGLERQSQQNYATREGHA